MSDRDHGTLACYRWGSTYGPKHSSAGCRCDKCTAAATLYQAKLKRDHARGVERLEDCAEARAHLQWLVDHGVGVRRIVELTGLARNTVRNIIDGVTRRARPETIEAVLAVGTHLRADGALMPAASTRELIDELVASGFTRGQIALELGATTPNLQIRRDHVRVATHARVVEVHERLMRPTVLERQLVRERKQRARHADRVVDERHEVIR